jgi:hypothetical protein
MPLFMDVRLIAIGAIAFALVVIQFTGSVSSGEFNAPTTNTTTTTTTTIPDGDGLEAGVADGSGPTPCDDAISAGITAVGTHSFDLNDVSAQDTGNFLCVRNAGPGSITNLSALATAVQSSEVGAPPQKEPSIRTDLPVEVQANWKPFWDSAW